MSPDGFKPGSQRKKKAPWLWLAFSQKYIYIYLIDFFTLFTVKLCLQVWLDIVDTKSSKSMRTACKTSYLCVKVFSSFLDEWTEIHTGDLSPDFRTT